MCRFVSFGLVKVSFALLEFFVMASHSFFIMIFIYSFIRLILIWFVSIVRDITRLLQRLMSSAGFFCFLFFCLSADVLGF